MLFHLLRILTIILLYIPLASAQVSAGDSDSTLITFYPNSKFTRTDSGILVVQQFRGICKQRFEKRFFVPYQLIALVPARIIKAIPKPKEKLLTVHGNLTYFFNYRSYIDTPFAEKNVMQHTVQTRLDILVKEKYPFTVYLTSRRSNSGFFSNATDLSFQFHQVQMLENIKRDMRSGLDNLLANKALGLTPAQLYQREKDGLLKNIGDFSATDLKGDVNKAVAAKRVEIEEKFTKLYDDYKRRIQELEAVLALIKKESGAQELVEEKERKLKEGAGKANELPENMGTFTSKSGNLLKNAQELAADKEKMVQSQPGKIADSAERVINAKIGNAIAGEKQKNDSLATTTTVKLADKLQQLEKLQNEATQAEQRLKTFQKKITDSLQYAKRLIAGITDETKLEAYLRKTGGRVKDMPALQRMLLAVKQIGLGRSWIDYSELTVKNISLGGFNIEMNPGNIYFAAAAGKVNYGFRDYIVKGNKAGSNQSVGLLRAGFGQKDRNNIIVTYYAGQKALLTQAGPADAATQKISGISIEFRKKIDAHNYIIGEYARSAAPASKTKIFDWNNNTNEAFSIKAGSDYGRTKLNGYYRKTGAAFQSFTLFPTNSRQEAWMLRATQLVWKKRVLLDAAIRKNDFNSPVAAPVLSNTNVFKSFQITARIPRYPFVSAGYYPSSQLTLNDNLLFENRYNTLNVMMSHTYFAGKLSMSTNATYTKFYNQGSDTGFIYYNAATFTLNHSLNLTPFILQGIITITNQSLLKQTTIEPVVNYQLKNKLSFSASVKWNRVNHTETLWGGTAGLNLYLKKFGALQMQYDKIYLPGYNRNLLPVDMGRLVFSRVF